ncbi:Sugar-binding cellulase-like protein [Posidoniimonas corsicana]|uniref:Sugar-binding cellulase-like protein n=1 Tax=Posidoniimonas corsicana TaxID=1938618 RepID=A0A5C5V6F0_9BACT|nr:endo-1,4-beta-xylanase [Posidoniimonas corsicana]TWT33831.1 Sugar-binding cellulase-like protein [Posidoniimonas corsicana]
MPAPRCHARRFGAAALLVVLSLSTLAPSAPAGERWTKEQANAWYAKTGWLVGCNFNPSTAMNQLEMWQADTFDPETINRELGWAEGLGFNSVRVYLHDLCWKEGSEAFCQRIERFLKIADSHGIGVMFVPLDGVWDPFPKAGPQRDPKPHTHNSGWVQSPGAEILRDPARHDELKPYIQGLLTRFKDDKRIHAWDLFNEPDNPNVSAYGTVELPNKAEMAMLLLEKAFAWAREVNPSQPLTSAMWYDDWSDHDAMKPMDRFMTEQSDIITFHCYDPADVFAAKVEQLERYGRPVLCTEYMARPRGSTFEAILPICKEHKVGAYNWGFVDGRSQTIYPWDSWNRPYTAEPELWFHDIFRPDGTPYLPAEVKLIKQMTGGE